MPKPQCPPGHHVWITTGRVLGVFQEVECSICGYRPKNNEYICRSNLDPTSHNYVWNHTPSDFACACGKRKPHHRRHGHHH